MKLSEPRRAYLDCARMGTGRKQKSKTARTAHRAGEIFSFIKKISSQRIGATIREHLEHVGYLPVIQMYAVFSP